MSVTPQLIYLAFSGTQSRESRTTEVKNIIASASEDELRVTCEQLYQRLVTLKSQALRAVVDGIEWLEEKGTSFEGNVMLRSKHFTVAGAKIMLEISEKAAEWGTPPKEKQEEKEKKTKVKKRKHK